MEIPVGFEPEHRFGVGASHRKTVEWVITTMREQGDGAFLLSDMADVAHLSPYHFARVFRRVTGIPPGEFQSAVRLERAKQLLLTTDLSVTEVCFEVGYNSLGTFTTRFTQLVGVSPGRVRRLPEALPEALHEALGGMDSGGSLSATPPSLAGTGVTFRVYGPDLTGTWIFAGLFTGAIPQRRPVVGDILTSPGVHRLPPPPDGLYHLMAAALPRSEDPLKSLRPGAALRVGRGREPVVVREGRAAGLVDVEMLPERVTDPPVLISLPALLLETFGRHSLHSRRTAR